MARSSVLMTVARPVRAMIVAAILAAVAALGAAPLTMAASAPGAAPHVIGCSQLSAAAVGRELGIGGIHAEIVIIVDISFSMETNNLYSTVNKLVPALISTLAKQEPQDLVGVITLGTRGRTKVVVDPGPPSTDTWIPPPEPVSGASDFGRALQEAVGLFSHPPQGANPQVGEVLMLSDGQVYEPMGDDSEYGGKAPDVFAKPAWMDLQKAASNLPIPVTGFSMPLTSSKALQASQNETLADVFPAVQLQYNKKLLTDSVEAIREMQAATTGSVQDTKIKAAIAQDDGAGLQIAWSGQPDPQGKRLDMGKPGHARVRVTVTSRARHVPLCLSGISISPSGPFVVRGGGLPSSVRLAPGQSATWYVQLTWQPHPVEWTPLGDPRTLPVHPLTLTGTLSSPFASVIVPADPAFSYGPLLGYVSPTLMASVPTKNVLQAAWGLAVALIVLLLVMIFGNRTRLRGHLVLAAQGKDNQTIQLRGLRLRYRTDTLRGIPSWMIVRGSPRGKMRISMEIDERPWTEESAGVWLSRGGRDDNIRGMAVEHLPRAKRKRFSWLRLYR